MNFGGQGGGRKGTSARRQEPGAFQRGLPRGPFIPCMVAPGPHRPTSWTRLTFNQAALGLSCWAWGSHRPVSRSAFLLLSPANLSP